MVGFDPEIEYGCGKLFGADVAQRRVVMENGKKKRCTLQRISFRRSLPIFKGAFNGVLQCGVLRTENVALRRVGRLGLLSDGEAEFCSAKVAWEGHGPEHVLNESCFVQEPLWGNGSNVHCFLSCFKGTQRDPLVWGLVPLGWVCCKSRVQRAAPLGKNVFCGALSEAGVERSCGARLSPVFFLKEPGGIVSCMKHGVIVVLFKGAGGKCSCCVATHVERFFCRPF